MASVVPTCSDDNLALASLASLIGQNVASMLLLRWTQTRPGAVPYSATAAVALGEVMKLVVCAAILAATRGVRETYAVTLRDRPLLMIVPAAVYALQNVLMFVALANLEVTLFQVIYQSKVVVTALGLWLALDRKFSARRWVAMGVLVLGIVFTQIDKNSAPSSRPQSPVVGVAAAVCASLASAIASVYFEHVVKQPSESLLVRNVQLAFFSLAVAVPAYRVVDGAPYSRFFAGFDRHVVLLVVVQAAGGLIVAAVIKYADNVLKGFATALSIGVCGAFSFAWLGFRPTMSFVFGVGVVMVATALYSVPENRRLSSLGSGEPCEAVAVPVEDPDEEQQGTGDRVPTSVGPRG